MFEQEVTENSPGFSKDNLTSFQKNGNSQRVGSSSTRNKVSHIQDEDLDDCDQDMFGPSKPSVGTQISLGIQNSTPRQIYNMSQQQQNSTKDVSNDFSKINIQDKESKNLSSVNGHKHNLSAQNTSNTNLNSNQLTYNSGGDDNNNQDNMYSNQNQQQTVQQQINSKQNSHAQPLETAAAYNDKMKEIFYACLGPRGALIRGSSTFEAINSPARNSDQGQMQRQESDQYSFSLGKAQASQSIGQAQRLDNFGMMGIQDYNRFIIKQNDITINYDKRIGGGAYGQVYQCDYLNKLVAAKIMEIKPSRDSFVPQLQELKILELIKSKADHPNIVHLHGIVIKEDQIIIIMEYYKVGALGSVLYPTRSRPSTTIQRYYEMLSQSIKERLNLILGVARGIQHLHELNIIHRDLKPDNILMEHSNTESARCSPVITDFGLSAEVQKGSGVASVRPGTYHYCAVEYFIQGMQTVTKKSDVYTFGLIGLEILQMKPPWGKVDKDLQVFQIQNNVLQNGAKPQVDAKYSEDPKLKTFVNLLKKTHSRNAGDRPDMDECLVVIQQTIKDYPDDHQNK